MICSKCLQNKPLKEFRKHSKRRVYHHKCFACEQLDKVERSRAQRIGIELYRKGVCKCGSKEDLYVLGRRANHSFSCGKCRAEVVKAPLKRRSHKLRVSYIFRNYGITVAQYQRLIDRPCDICGSRERIGVDHDHDTLQVRGVLCKPCNSALGFLCDSPRLVKKAYEYLRSRKGLTASV